MLCGIRLPAGLRESERLPEPIFTPASKATTGHDENISYDRVVELIGPDLAEQGRALTLKLYDVAGAHTAARGVILADTKFEFGLVDGQLTLIDEVLTPDSSRFWPAEDYEPGRSQRSFDKQYVRDWLAKQDWDFTPPGLPLPPLIVERTRARYVSIYERITGRPFADWTGS
jgi:phosphoribosylaminoimidazole-succinocarboxamide synthase